MGDGRRVRSVALAAIAIPTLLAACNDDGGGRRADVSESVPETTDTDSGSTVAGSTVAESTAVESTAAPATTTERAVVDDDAAAALAVCSALRAQANVRTDLANSTAADIAAQTPEQRYQTLFDSYDTAADAERAFGDSLADLDMPAIPERDDLMAQIADGAEAAADEFVDEQGRFAEAVDGVVTDGDWQGRVGEFFNSVEKANSLVEPVIIRYDRVELQHAFLDEPECRHVIQQFIIDD